MIPATMTLAAGFGLRPAEAAMPRHNPTRNPLR